MAKTLHISDKEIQVQAERILSAPLRGESALALCYPGCRISYILSVFLQTPSLLKKYMGRYYTKFQFITVTLEKNDTVESFLAKLTPNKQKSSLVSLCRDIIRHGKEPYFFIIDADAPPLEVVKNVVGTIHSCILQLGRVSATLFFETYIFAHSGIGELFRENNKFLQNIHYFPTYSNYESTLFLQNLALDWRINAPSYLMKQIATQCGGSLWLMREALRCYRDYNLTDMNDIQTTPGMQLRIQAILSKLTAEEQQNLIQIRQGHIQKVAPDVQSYFARIGLIRPHHKKWALGIPLLFAALDKLHMSRHITAERGRIFYRGNDISSQLRPQEKIVLISLLNRKGTVVSRELLAKALWRDRWEEMYSDWAIDKTVSRLRTNLKTIGIPQDLIQVKKRRGFII